MEIPFVSPELETFGKQFNFQRGLAGQVRVTREAFTTAYYECLDPRATEITTQAGAPLRFRPGANEYEVELVSGPCHIEQLHEELVRSQQYAINGSLLHVAALPHHYRTKDYVGSGVGHTRIEVFVSDRRQMLKMYNNSIRYYDQLQSRKEVAALLAHAQNLFPHSTPGYLASWEHFRQWAAVQGIEHDIGSLKSVIRMTPQGSVEFRTFEATTSVELIIGWAYLCHALYNLRD